jgi:diadenylate cyclase
MPTRRASSLHDALAKLAPGTPLREGLDRIVRARMGALVVIGDGPDVLNICSGGFLLDAPFSPQRLSELAKMDGAIIIGPDAERIARANVHLVPDPATPTSETGTRHRTAERVARSIRVPVVSVSEDMRVIAVYVDGIKHVMEEIPRLLNRSNQAMQTLERYKARLDSAAASLSALEIEDTVTVRDVATLLQRSEMVRRIADEIETYTIELGTDARLIRIQLDELMSDADDDPHAVLSDYKSSESGDSIRDSLDQLAAIDNDELLDLRKVAAVLRRPSTGDRLDAAITPRGYRVMHRLPFVPKSIADEIVDQFEDLPHLQRATSHDLVRVAGLDNEMADVVRDGLARLTQSSILERYS